MLKLGRDLICDTFILTTHLSCSLVRVTSQGVQVLLVPDLLLLLLNFETSYILLELTLLYPMIILPVLQLNLCFLLQLSQLIQILEHQMFDPLFVYLNLNLVFLTQILHLPLLVPECSFQIITILLGHDPEVVDTLSLILIHPSEVFLLTY